MMTYEEKMDEIVERIYQAVMEDFDLAFTEDELEKMYDNDTYFDKAREHTLGVEGYERTTFNEM